MARWQLGPITIDRVVEFERPLFEASALLPDADQARIDRHRTWLEPQCVDPVSGLLVLSFHTFVIRTPRRTILVDTCSGNDKPRPGKPRYHLNRWPYLERLADVGVAPDAVDVVVCTHLHVDHVGWNTRLLDRRWVPTFPRAEYLLGDTEWEFWRAEYASEGFLDDRYDEDSLVPVFESGQARLVKADHAIDDGVWLEASPGHTPGHLSVRVQGGGHDAVMTGDLMHHPLQCAEPDWSSGFCVDPVHSRRTRRAFLERHADTDTLVMPAHFPAPSAGRIVRSGAAYRFVFDDPAPVGPAGVGASAAKSTQRYDHGGHAD